MTTTEEQPREAMAAQIEALASPKPASVGILRDLTVKEIERDGVMSSTMVRAGLLLDILDELYVHRARANLLPAIVTALRQAEAAPGVVTLPVGTHVAKPKGYPYPGQIRSAFTNAAGALRYVVESDLAPGMLHIFSPGQIEPDTASPPIEVERTVADGALVGVEADLKSAITEMLSHRGENPYRVLRGGMELWETWLPSFQAAIRYLPALASCQHAGAEGDRWPVDAKYQKGETVQKKGRASWRGKIVGWYRTDITALGYAVESAFEPGSVQIYPESGLVHWLPAAPEADEGERT